MADDAEISSAARSWSPLLATSAARVTVLLDSAQFLVCPCAGHMQSLCQFRGTVAPLTIEPIVASQVIPLCFLISEVSF